MKVVTSGWYILFSSTRIKASGYLYKEHFNPSEPKEKSLAENSGGCLGGQFRLVSNLQSDVMYVLVVTTVQPENTGEFTIYATGLNEVTFKRISK